MAHDADLIVTITVALVIALLGGYLAARLKLPPILGFLVAGVAIGPFTPGFTADSQIAAQLADVGIILLMFGVGVQFSIKDLLAVRKIAVPGALIQMVFVVAAVAGVAMLWNWSLQAGLFLGLAVSIASTVIPVHTLTERNEIDSPSGRVTVGWLIVEDLLTVLALVLIPVLVLGTNGGESQLALDLLWTIGKVIFLAAAMIIGGARVVPWILVQVARTGSRELFMLSVLSLALGVAYVSASIFDVSIALGAFLAGLVISESDLSHQAAAEALPLRDAFAVLFFVSVGMLLDPAFLIESPGMILAILVLTVVLKPLVCIVIVLAYGLSTRMALTVGAARGQIGEFSFILAGMGLTLNIFPEAGYSLILAGAILSITVNPLLFAGIEPIDARLRRNRFVMEYLDPRIGGPDSFVIPDSEEEPIRGHAVLCGYGRVGSVISQALERRGFRQIVVERDRHLVERLRDSGIPAFYGDAANPMIQRQLHLDRARVLVVAIPDPIAARLIVDAARKVNPNLPIVVRTHNARERERLATMGVSEAVMGELELALEMTRFTLRRFGVGGTETQSILQGLRVGANRATQDRDET
jgi:monovalent cation:H+ antiporter-2, CPA2 family